MSKIVVALGGNALLRRGEPAEASRQQRNLLTAAPALARLAAEHELVLTHGNGPQVGLLALEGEAYHEVRPYPLDLLGAESQGMIGYLIAQALTGLVEREVAVVLTRVEVDPADPAFAAPSKPIGPTYDEEVARRRADETGWAIAADGPHFRRVVPSPEPLRIVELPLIRRLVDAGALVVCAGGGGIPVAAAATGYRGVEAVIDKDLTASLLACELGAERLVILTDVPAVARGWRTAHAAPIRRTTPQALRQLAFAPGSMGPKVEAACRFVERSGGVASIGSLGNAAAVVAGSAGTQVALARRRGVAQRARRPTRTCGARSTLSVR